MCLFLLKVLLPCPAPPCLVRTYSYTTMGICTLIAYLIVNGPEEATVAGRARPQALREIAEEDAIFADYAADKPLQQATAARLRAQGKHPDRCARVDKGQGHGRGGLDPTQRSTAGCQQQRLSADWPPQQAGHHQGKRCHASVRGWGDCTLC